MGKPYSLDLRERIIGFDGVPANGLGHHVLAQSSRIDFLAGGFELIQYLQHKLPRIGAPHKRRQRVQEEGSLAKLTQAHAQTRQCRQLLADKMRVAR